VAVEQIATAHYRRQVALARRTAEEVAQLWAAIDRVAIAASWLAQLPRAVAVIGSAQAIAAASAGTYLDDLLDAYGKPPGSAGRVNIRALSGIASDGRELQALLQQPRIGALTAIGQGASPARALAGGRLNLDMIVRTQIADAGRVADGIALTARRQLSGYVRMLSPPACPRCVILAGKKYRWNTGFLRHPRCDCRHIPAPDDAADDLRTDPAAYFKSLSRFEQDRVFTATGAQALREGADIGRVVNARRGMYTAGGRQFTHEAAGRRARLMPEQIYREAKGDRDEAIRLLRLHGYLI
jgi:hypothetical protein